MPENTAVEKRETQLEDLPELALKEISERLNYQEAFSLARTCRTMLKALKGVLAARAYERMPFVISPMSHQSKPFSMSEFAMPSSAAKIVGTGIHANNSVSLKLSVVSARAENPSRSIPLSIVLGETEEKIAFVRLGCNIGFVKVGNNLYALTYGPIPRVYDEKVVARWLKSLYKAAHNPGLIQRFDIGGSPENIVFVDFEDLDGKITEFFVPYQRGCKLSDLEAFMYVSEHNEFARFKIRMETSDQDQKDSQFDHYEIAGILTWRSNILRLTCYDNTNFAINVFDIQSDTTNGGECVFKTIAHEDNTEFETKLEELETKLEEKKYNMLRYMTTPLQSKELSGSVPLSTSSSKESSVAAEPTVNTFLWPANSEYVKFHEKLVEACKPRVKESFAPVASIVSSVT